MIKEKFFLNEPVQFKNFCKVYPPQVQEVFSNDDFWKYVRVLTITQEDIEDEIFKGDYSVNKEIPTPFEYLLATCYNEKGFEKIVNSAFEFFTKKKVSFLYREKALLIGDIEEILPNIENLNDLNFFKEEDYFDFQNLIRASIGEDTIESPNLNMPLKLRRMKAKSRERDKIKAKTKGLSSFALMTSICCMGIGINPLNIGQLSYCAMKSLLHRYQEKEKYNIDIKSILAGADSKKIKPQYWIKDFDDNGGK